MKKNYNLNDIGWIGIILMMLTLTFTSCKKEENKENAPKSVQTTQSTTVRSTYVLIGSDIHDGGTLSEVSDTIYSILIDTTMYYTIPLNYNAKFDTMLVAYRQGPTMGTKNYNVDHVLKTNSAYKLVGWVGIGITHMNVPNSNCITVGIQRQLVGNNYNTGSYNLTYTKI